MLELLKILQLATRYDNSRCRCQILIISIMKGGVFLPVFSLSMCLCKYLYLSYLPTNSIIIFSLPILSRNYETYFLRQQKEKIDKFYSKRKFWLNGQKYVVAFSMSMQPFFFIRFLKSIPLQNFCN